jgi:acyl-CoA synthetase (AMP-forming)/AMP-acid ligase II
MTFVMNLFCIARQLPHCYDIERPAERQFPHFSGFFNKIKMIPGQSIWKGMTQYPLPVNTHRSRIITDTGNPLSLYDLLFCGGQDPGHPALEAPGYSPVTYSCLREQITLTVKQLNAAGFSLNDRVAVVMPGGPEMALAILGVMAGCTVIPFNPSLRAQEFEHLFLDLRIQAVIVPKDYPTPARDVALTRTIPVLDLVPDGGTSAGFSLEPAGVREHCDPRFAGPADTAILLRTSGTTAVPKIVPLSHGVISRTMKKFCQALTITKADRNIHLSPMYHAMGLFGNFLAPLTAGATVVCIRDFIPSDFISLLRTWRPTYYAATPPLHRLILRELKKDGAAIPAPHSLRFIRTSAAPLSPDVCSGLEAALGVPVIEDFGMSEAAGVVTINMPPRPGSLGVPIVGSLAIMDGDGRVLKPLQTGEIVLKGDTLFSGYENAPEENTAAFRAGWFHTGDTGYLDHDGYLYLTGRIKEVINKGGFKVSPAEVDAVLALHPGVRDVMTFRIDDPLLLEDIAALVVRSDESVSERMIRAWLLDRIVPSKIPRKIFFVDAIPKSPTGKPLRYEGTRQYSQGNAARK